MQGSTLTRTMNVIIEGCWLLAVITTPLFFDIYSRRVFEPDKITVLRNLVIIMVIAQIVKWVEAAPRLVARRGGAKTPAADDPAGNQNPAIRTLQRLWCAFPLTIPAAIFLFIYILATIHSIDPAVSFWGSYDRLQGTYTWMNYMALFLFMITYINRWEQIERIITAAIFTSIPVSLYGVFQHFHIDPLQWGGDVFSRVASTMGNAIFLGAYLLMVVPLTIYRLYLQAVDLMQPPAMVTAAAVTRSGRRSVTTRAIPAWQRRREQRNSTIMLALYTVILLLELFAILYTFSRGPFGGLVVALLTFGFLIGLRYKVRWLTGSVVGLLVLGVLILGLANKTNPLIHSSSNGLLRLVAVTSSESGTSEVRTLIWKGSLQLIKEHPLLGIGPETMLLAYNPVYPPALGHIEAANASPDRNHDEEMDYLVMSGALGLLAYLAILGTFFWMCFRLLKRLTDTRAIVLVIALAAIVLGHIGEGLVGIAIVSTLTMLWTCFAMVSLIYQRTSAWSLVPGGAVPAQAEAAAVEAAVPAGAGNRTARPSSGPARQGPARTAAGRRPPQPPANTPMSEGSMAVVLGSLIVGIAVIAGLLVLFYNNYQVVYSDIVFKNALNYETAADNYASQGQQALQASAGTTQTTGSTSTAQQYYNGAFFYFTQAINSFQDAINAQPSQDFYYLYMGKTLLERVQADRNVNDTTARNNDIVQAESILLRAHAISPLDTDHSANLGRLYSLWATWDPSKWPDALQWFAHATQLSPHTSVLIDEYGTTVRSYGQYLASIGKTAQAHAEYLKAADIFKQSAHIDPQQSDAFANWGDIEFQPTYLNNPPAAIYPYTMTLALLNPNAPNLLAIYANLSIAYLETKKYKEALQDATMAVNLLVPQLKSTPNTSPNYQQLVQSYDQMLAVENQANAQLNKKK